MDDTGLAADCLVTEGGGTLLRFAGTPKAIAVLRDTFVRLSSGQPSAGPGAAGDVSVEFRLSARGGAPKVAAASFVIDGDREQWKTRAELLGPLTSEPPGFQYLDYDRLSEIAMIVTTYPDRSF